MIKDRKTLVGCLSLTAALLWGSNLHRIWDGLRGQTEVAGQNQADSFPRNAPPGDRTPVWPQKAEPEPLERDPFTGRRLVAPEPEPAPVEAVAVEPEPPPKPAFRWFYLGRFATAGDELHLFRDGGSLAYIRKGDWLGPWQCTGIDTESLHFTDGEGHTHQLTKGSP